MNRKIFLLVIATMVGFAGPTTQAAPLSSNIQTLKKCVGSNLRGAKLRSVDLAGANLSCTALNNTKSVLESIVGP